MRATLKPFKNSRKDSDEMEVHTRIKVLNDENCRQRQKLKEVCFHFAFAHGLRFEHDAQPIHKMRLCVCTR